MREVTFKRDFSHRLNDTQVAEYKAGVTYKLPAAVARAAEDAKTIDPEPASAAPAKPTEPETD